MPANHAIDSGRVVALDVHQPIWERFYTVAPLVIIGTKEGEKYDLAPKHLAFPMGWDNYFAFVCTPRHGTYHNALKSGEFTVTYPQADQSLLASLTAQPREPELGDKPIVEMLPTFSARRVDGIFLQQGYLFLECKLEKVVDGFGENSLLAGRVVAAYAQPEALRDSEKEEAEILRDVPLMSFLYPNRFAILTESLAFPFPANFKK
jgi:flavin reductase (DIM6/NTAB) family NADH-FMN oxidoreductase RutF